MNADAIRTLYGYHFTLNRRLWKQCIAPLSQRKFIRESTYSLGSIRNQVVHMMSVDERWFARLQGNDPPTAIDPAQYNDRVAVRTRWNTIEADMRVYLDKLNEDETQRIIEYHHPQRGLIRLAVWQILMIVINHATDHRAQILAMLHRLGAPTMPQDLFTYFLEQEHNS